MNGDRVQDCAVVIKGNNSKFLNKNDGLGSDIFDTNPRILIVLFKNAVEKRYEIAEQSNTFIMIPDLPTMTEPFQSVKLKMAFCNWILKYGIAREVGELRNCLINSNTQTENSL